MANTFNIPPVTTQQKKPVLKEGNISEAVKDLQLRLYELGVYPCGLSAGDVVDGIFGEMTKEAVITFQYTMFLRTDGIVGENTWLALEKGAPVDMATLKRGSKGELVKAVQQRLQVISRYESGIKNPYEIIADGKFGPRTETAVKALQKRYDLMVDGIIGEETWFVISQLISEVNLSDK